jgi:glutaredoxin
VTTATAGGAGPAGPAGPPCQTPGVTDEATDQPSDQPSDRPSDRPAGAAGEARVLLYGKPGCHLCDDARRVVAAVCAEVGATWQEVDITTDPDLQSRYWEQIPVTLVDGRQHDFWRVDPARLRAALDRPR